MFKFRFPKNDWTPVWTNVGEWTVTNNFGEYKATERCTYTIRYSPSRNKYKLICSGFQWQLHGMYKIAIKKLNELNGYNI